MQFFSLMKIGVIILNKMPENRIQQNTKRIIHNNKVGSSTEWQK